MPRTLMRTSLLGGWTASLAVMRTSARAWAPSNSNALQVVMMMRIPISMTCAADGRPSTLVQRNWPSPLQIDTSAETPAIEAIMIFSAKPIRLRYLSIRGSLGVLRSYAAHFRCRIFGGKVNEPARLCGRRAHSNGGLPAHRTGEKCERDAGAI